MKPLLLFLTAAFYLSALTVYGQPTTYKSFKIRYDSIKGTGDVIDTLTNFRFNIDYPYYRHSYFSSGFVYVRTGDMKGLMDLKGRKLLQPCHWINFNDKDSIISAWCCYSASWIFLNYNGDTLSLGRIPVWPTLNNELNIAMTETKDRTKIVAGYIDKKAKWKIKPEYERVLDFYNGKAKVKFAGKWGVIDTDGKWIIVPTYDNSDFEIPK